MYRLRFIFIPQFAVITRSAFYPIVVYLTTSKVAVVVLSNAALVLVFAGVRLLKALFLGDLRTNEIERVNDSIRFTIPEVFIALTLFREELSLRVLALFIGLLVFKFFHVVVDERLNHVRVAAWTIVSVARACKVYGSC